MSILLAFAVQAWWEQRQERRLEVERLSSLRLEVADVVERIPDAERRTRSALASHEALIRQFPGSKLAPGDSLLYWLADIARPAAFDAPQAVLRDLLSSGGLQRIVSDRVRLGIAEYQLTLETHTQRRDASWEIWVNRLQPYLESRVSRVDRLRSGPYAANAKIPFNASPFEPEYSDLFADRAFESMLAERWMRLNEADAALGMIESAAKQLLQLIDEELGRI